MILTDQLVVGNLTLVWGARTYVMGIINVTPDSFSGDGLVDVSSEAYIDLAYQQALQFVEAGVDILDVGGESTRPGASIVSLQEEMDRVIPVVERLANSFDVPVSIDTYKSQVASAALDAGAQIVNDVWALRVDPKIAEVVSEYDVPVILMHNRSKPSNAEIQDRLGGRYIGIEYDDLIEDIKKELMVSVEIAHQAGVSDQQIILDPGIGFGKTVPQNLEILNRLDEIRALGYPVLLGPSRKSFIGYTLDLPPDDRIEGTAATIAIGIDRGADIVRVHDVREMVRIARMTDAIVR